MSGKKQNLSVGLSVCLYHHSSQTGSFAKLKHGLKISQNSYHSNEKKPKIVFLPEKPLELEI